MGNKQEVTGMAIKEIMMHLPEELLQSLDEVIEGESLTRDEVLTRLIEDYIQRRNLEKARREGLKTFDVAEITRAYLPGRLERKGSINDIDINAEEVEKAIVKTFGISDPVELIEKLRSSRW